MQRCAVHIHERSLTRNHIHSQNKQMQKCVWKLFSLFKSRNWIKFYNLLIWKKEPQCSLSLCPILPLSVWLLHTCSAAYIIHFCLRIYAVVSQTIPHTNINHHQHQPATTFVSLTVFKSKFMLRYSNSTKECSIRARKKQKQTTEVCAKTIRTGCNVRLRSFAQCSCQIICTSN